VQHRVPLAERDRVLPVTAPHLAEAPADVGEGLVPAHLHEAVLLAAHRVPEPVRVFVDVLERDRLRAQVAPAQRIVAVAADPQDPAALVLDGEPADGFAQVAGAVVRLAHRRRL